MSVRARARSLTTVPPEERTRLRQHCLSPAHGAEEFDRLATRYQREGHGPAKELHFNHRRGWQTLAEFLIETGGANCGESCALVDAVPADLPRGADEIFLGSR